MTTTTITIQVDTDAARVYQSASEEDKKKLQALMSLWLREFGKPSKPLQALMDEISDKAQARGLTPETLEALLNER